MELRIKVTEDSRGFVADAVDMPGTPPVGVGQTALEAIGALVIRLSVEPVWKKHGWPQFAIAIGERSAP